MSSKVSQSFRIIVCVLGITKTTQPLIFPRTPFVPWQTLQPQTNNNQGLMRELLTDWTLRSTHAQVRDWMLNEEKATVFHCNSPHGSQEPDVTPYRSPCVPVEGRAGNRRALGPGEARRVACLPASLSPLHSALQLPCARVRESTCLCVFVWMCVCQKRGESRFRTAPPKETELFVIFLSSRQREHQPDHLD